ncbi:MAG TPA: Na/Pi cotransporter family protein [Clostridiales bacterium]|nr:Na/Pi cotransporter family protein [Clostridiales bacterium]
MTIFHGLALIGGLAFFLYGMDLMGHSLQLISGKRLQKILESLTDNLWKGILLGAGVTAVIQSSSATTTLVVSLVNSGIMKLFGATGVIMGANIGTTVTAWLLSMTGATSDNLFVKLMNPTNFSPFLAIVGVLMIMMGKRESRRTTGKIMVGFAILIFGMNTMSDAMKPLAQMKSFQLLFIRFSNPVLGMLVGALLTMVIQSSSAAIGIMQALSVTGIVPFSAALPILMGQNIGTCITALLASLGANRNAKRAATIHILFNAIGSIVLMSAFYLINSFIHIPLMDTQATPALIAITHTAFNVLSTLILSNFANGLVKLTYVIIPESKKEKEEKSEEFRLLDERLLETPVMALQSAFKVSVRMLERAREGARLALGLIFSYNNKNFERVKYLEGIVDEYQDKLGDYLFKISQKHITERDNRLLNIMMNSIVDIERISDHSLGIALEAQRVEEDPACFSQMALSELAVYSEAVNTILDMTLDVYRNEDVAQARLIEPLEEVIDRLNNALRLRHISRMKKGLCSAEAGVMLTDLSNAMERVGDHCSNIAITLIEIYSGSFDTHRYLTDIKEKDPSYQDKVMELLIEYKLPEEEGEK